MMSMDYGKNESVFQFQNGTDATNEKYSLNIHRSSPDNSISKLTDLPLDIMHVVFDYLSLGDVYYSFYHLFKNFVDACFPCLNLTSMSYRQYLFYHEYILFNNAEHSQKISSLILSNERPFNQIERFLPAIHLYTNLKKLHLYSPDKKQLENLPLIVPNICELYISLQNGKSLNIKWLSSLKNLKICSIHPKIYGTEIDNSMHSLSSFLSSLSITLSSTYDFYTLLPLLPVNTINHLNVSLYDSEFSYIKTFSSPISSAKELVDFSFNMSLILMKNASCLYDIIRFVSTTLRHVKTLTILCRSADGILIDEEKFRNYLSFIYSVNTYKLFIEMNNLLSSSNGQPIFDETAYSYPFWVDKGIHVNVYRNKDDQIKRVRIYTLPLVSKIVNLPNNSEDIYKLIKSSSNIYQFKSDVICNSIYYFDNDLTLTPKSIYSSSDISLLFHLPRLSSIEVTEDEMFSFVMLFTQNKQFVNIRKLQLHYMSKSLLEDIRQIFDIFPSLRSLSIDKVDELEIFADILDRYLLVSPNKQVIIHLCIGGSYFNDICLSNVDEKQLRINLEEIFLPLHKRKNSYDISFNRNNRFIDIWF